MKKVIRLTENELTNLISRAIEEQSQDPLSRAQRLSASFNQRTPPVTSKPSQPQSQNVTSVIKAGTYTNSTVRVNGNGSVEFEIGGRGTFTFSCENGNLSVKKIK